MAPEKISILLADDSQIIHDGLSFLVKRQPAMEVVGHSYNGKKTIQLARQLMPDIAVIDYYMPQINGIDVASQIIGDQLPITTFLLSSDLTKQNIIQALDLGIDGIMLKDSVFSEFILAIRMLAKNENYLCSKVSKLIGSGIFA